MNVGQLFISLGVKGAEKTIASVSAIKEGLKSATSLSLETKAGLLGAGYALEQFMSKGATQAQILTNMSNVLGVGAEQLEIFGNAAKHSGTSLDTVANSILTMQQALTGIKLGEAAPKWFQFFAGRMGGLPDFETLRTHPEEMIKRVQQFVDQEMKTTGDRGMINMVLQGLGLSAMAPSFFKGDFRPEQLVKAKDMARFSEGDLASLDVVQQKLADISNTIEVSLGKLAGKFGPRLLADVQKLLPAMTDLAVQFTKLVDAVMKTGAIDKVFEGWTTIFKGLGIAVEAFTDSKKWEQLKANLKEFFSLLPGIIGHQVTGPALGLEEGGPDKGTLKSSILQMMPAIIGLDLGSLITDALIKKFSGPTNVPNGAAAATPNAPAAAAPTSSGGPQASVTVHQNFSFQDKNEKAVADAAARGLRSAFIQNPILNQWA